MKECKKVFLRFTDEYELILEGDANYKIDKDKRVVTVTRNGFCSFFNFDQMQFIYSITDEKENLCTSTHFGQAWRQW